MSRPADGGACWRRWCGTAVLPDAGEDELRSTLLDIAAGILGLRRARA